MMDGVQVVNDSKDMDAIHAISCVFALYFVYGIAYPRKLVNILNFIERVLLQMEQSTKAPRTSYES